ncbi:MAG: efflux RND transporter permease subunit, partial [bacterium]|nr:efflux RND transporter permease subunit [bacterium]
MSDSPSQSAHGPLAWMVHNRVTPNILMLVFILGGLFMTTRIKQEVFPAFDLDQVSIRVPYPGASPEEVEQGIILAIEEAVRGLDGVKEVNATASEGMGSVIVELMVGVDQQKVYQDIQQQVDGITTFPEDAEEKQVVLETRRRGVLTLQIYGEATEWALRDLAELVRDQLLQDPNISLVELSGARDYEVRVEVSQDQLRTYGLTLNEIARKIDATAVEVPGGSVKTASGEILMRMKERRNWAREFARIPIVTAPDGTTLYLSDIAVVREGFEESNEAATYNGHRTVGLDVYRIGDQTPIQVSDAVRSAMDHILADLPPGVHYAINNDRSTIYRQRLNLLLRNGFLGLVVVLGVLGLFLEFKLAFWVTLGIPISFLGSFLFLSGMGVSLNIISLFAFIVALGIVVDDAIISGENIFEYRQQGMSFMDAAIRGARDVSVPITFSILTNVVAFLPLLYVPGLLGKIWKVIPAVVITVFLISWVESLLILPSHLAHGENTKDGRIAAFLHRHQQRFSRKFVHFVETVYAPFLKRCMHARYLTSAIAVTALMIVIAYALSGRMGLILMPKIESDSAAVTAVLPYGSAMEKAERVRDKLVAGANAVARENGGDLLIEGVYATITENRVDVFAYLTPPEVRPISTTRVAELWRASVGDILGLEVLKFESDRGGPGSGPSITVELSHRDIGVLDRASAALATALEQFSQTKDIDDGYTPGKRQLDFQLTPEGRSLGLTSADVARQVRSAFYGAEALRQQRGRNEVRVRVSLPEAERVREFDIEHLLIRTPSGRHVPLRQVTEVTPGRAYTSITRRDGRRTVSVTSAVEPVDETNQVLVTLNAEILPQLALDYPGLAFGFEGRQADMQESLSALAYGFLLAVVLFYVLLAIPFRSYTQPLIVLVAIPFGIFGAIIGHLIMGYSLSIISLMGIIALSGVVINDALVMIDYANIQRRAGAGPFEAIHSAGVRRFRPILLPTLTPFGGLSPMIFETSRQARFMIPMALSLGYGIVFATGVILVLVPCLYMMME